MMAVNLPGDGKSAQGTALTPDGSQLIVADYSRGVGAVDLATFKTTILPRQDGKPLRGIDGLVRCGSTYYAVYNGAAPGFLVSFTRTDKGIEIDRPLGSDDAAPTPHRSLMTASACSSSRTSGWATIDKARFQALGGGADPRHPAVGRLQAVMSSLRRRAVAAAKSLP